MQKILKKRKINAYNVVLIIITLVFMIFMFSGITLSHLNNGKKESKQVDAVVFNVGDLAINYIDGNKIELDYPTKKEYKYNFSITNTSTSRLYYSIYLNDTVIVNKNIKIRLLDANNKEIYKEKLVEGENLIHSVSLIEPNITDRYTLIIENKNNRTDISSIITIDNESINKNTLQDLILRDNLFNINPKTNIGDIATEDEGLIKSYDDYGITYYFRGDINNNYIKIQGKMFRIIRINGDGTIRAILDDYADGEFAFNTNTDENKSNLIKLEKSTVINNLNSWLKENLSEYEDLLVASSFCSDTELDTIKDNIKYSKTHERLENNDTTFKCFGTSYLSKIGLISPDEVLFAGGSIKNDNNKYYLHNRNLNYDSWTIGSFKEDTNIEMYMLTSNGALVNNTITNPLHLRPVINISSSAVAKGEGTEENPYIIVK